MQRSRWSKVGYLSALVFVACVRSVTAEEAAKTAKKSVSFTGKLATVDAAGKTFRVEGRNATQTFKVTDKTRLFKTEPAELSGVRSGQRVHVYGKVSDDQTSIEARAIVITAGESKSRRGTSVTKMSAVGVVERSGDKLSVQTSDGKKIAVTTSEKTKVSRLAEAKFEDLKAGQSVMVNGRIQGDNVTATRVTILPPREGRKGRDKAQ